MMCRRSFVVWYVLMLVGYLLFFWCFPQIDIAVSRLFYSSEMGMFPLREHGLTYAIYYGVKLVSWAVGTMLLLALIASFLGRFYAPFKRISTRAVVYLLLVLAIGPGILVHWVSKEVWGRPRPVNIEEFGGSQAFIPAFHLSPSDHKSFTSGHAAMGFYFLALALFFEGYKRRAIYVVGLSLGALVGLVRIAQGGHFLSDVIGSGFIVVGTAHLLYYLLYRQRN